jgi:MoxR-like ATPase
MNHTEELNDDPLQPQPQEGISSSDAIIGDTEAVQQLSNAIKKEIQQVIVGQDELINLLIAGLLCSGHVLVEGPPGIAKTLTLNTLAKTIALSFRRLQFTPDLMPSDVTGTSIFNSRINDFEFKPGPVFTHMLLIDEINRAPAKTQASLFEVMEEKQVTTDGVSRLIDEPFMVVATQNPIEQEGTYKLPEAQQDRFLFKIPVTYPDLKEEISILQRFQHDFSQKTYTHEVKACVSKVDIDRARKAVEQVFIKPELITYIASIVIQTRQHPDLYLGASPRASLAMMKAAKAIAAMQGRSFVTPEDIQYVAYYILHHRIILSPDKEMEGYNTTDVIQSIIQSIDVPR